ncbi:hypothetical protein SOHN41_03824 [Shewanella sp. HN-41]|nr:hypothetical protein SOHN41_03824 [Shewanella sp. HN-41]
MVVQQRFAARVYQPFCIIICSFSTYVSRFVVGKFRAR